MYISDVELCPVTMFKLYTSKLHMNFNHLWQRPKNKELHYTNELQYDRQVVGHDPHERYTRYLSVGHSQFTIYANHCTRGTVLCTLDAAGFEARHIMAMSGNRSESSIKKYAVKCPDSKKREMSNVFSDNMTKRQKTQPTATVSVPPPPPPPGRNN